MKEAAHGKLLLFLLHLFGKAAYLFQSWSCSKSSSEFYSPKISQPLHSHMYINQGQVVQSLIKLTQCEQEF